MTPTGQIDAVLAINPGTTTTRCGLYQISGGEVECILEETLDHDEAKIAGYPDIPSQLQFRADCIADFLARIPDAITIVACAGRGGMLTPVPSGTIEVNDELVDFALHRPIYQHASNLGAPLAHALASLTDARGSLRIPEWRPSSLTARIKSLLHDIPVGSDESGPALSDNWGEPGLTPAERLLGWNAFAVLALDHGHPQAPQNAIAGSATAHCQLRFVTGTDSAETLPALRRHLDAGGFQNVTIIADKPAAPATRLDPDNAWTRCAAASLQATSGQSPHILPNLGGFIPNNVFSEILNLPTIWLPHSYGGCNQHAPDEHVLLELCESAAACMTGLFWDLPAIAPRR